MRSVEEVTGALIAVNDERGIPLRYRESGLVVGGPMPLDVLAGIRSTIENRTQWSRLDPIGEIASPEQVWGRTFHGHQQPRGLLLVRTTDSATVPVVTGCLDLTIEHLEWALTRVLTLDETRLVDQLRRLEGEQVNSSKQLDVAKVAMGIQEIFDAHAVTILVDEQDQLYLSATTDKDLAETDVSYQPGIGFSGLVFKTDDPIRLYNARDQDEISERFGASLNRGKVSSHPESLAASGDPFRFLAVPMRFSGRPQGVIRLLRTQQQSPFTLAEQEALQHSANLLAAMLFFSWRNHLGTALEETETEAVCITRSEPGTVYSVPRVVYAATGAKTLFGRDVVGLDARELYPDGEYDRVRKLLEQSIARGEMHVGPIKSQATRMKDGVEAIRWIEISYRLVTSPFVKPATHYTIAVIRDTTSEQMTALRDRLSAIEHERLTALLDQKGLAYFAADKDGLTVATSPTEERLTGYSSQDILGKHRKLLFDEPSDQEEFKQEMRNQRGKLLHAVKRLKKKNGDSFVAQGAAHVLFDDKGREIGYEGLYEDVTDRLRLQGYLDLDTKQLIKEQDLYERLRENAHFQLLFMNSFAHQVRSPLGALIAHLVNFRDGVIDATQLKQELKYIIGQARVCARQVENLTYMDQILRGDSFQFDRIKLAELAIQTKLDFDHLSAEKKLRIEVDGGSIDQHLRVRGHRELLRQVFVNLIDNGIKYSLPHSRIRVKGCPGPQSYLQVTSRGLPIPRNDRERIFERGFRQPEAKSAIPDGTGLGLWLVRKIVAAHGATIRCTEIHEYEKNRTAFQIFFEHPNLARSLDRRISWRSVA